MLGTTLIGLSSFSLAYAENTPAGPTAVNDPNTVKAIHRLEAKIIALQNANHATRNQANYQTDPYLLMYNKANNATVTDTSNNQVLNLSQYTNKLASNYTQNRITTSLQQVSNRILPNAFLKLAINANPQLNNTLAYLSSGITASDIPQVSGTNQTTANHDDYFNLASVTEPTAYSGDQQTAAESYIKYATHLDRQTLLNQVDFGKFQSLIRKQNNSVVKQALVQSLMNDQTFQKFMLYMRSMLTSQSVSLDVFNHLLAERIPVKNLGAEAGLKDTKGNTIQDASPLQVMAYLATKAHGKAWFRHVQAASPATVQREILTTLAQIERQNYQAYRQRELLLAVMASMQVQVTKANQISGTLLVQQTKSAVDNLVKNNGAQSSNDDQTTGGSGSLSNQDQAKLDQYQKKHHIKQNSADSGLSPKEKASMEKYTKQGKK
ncbi:MAG: hypothetical protein K0U12_00900 [Gammaproteobacteria bacterium]|nr:hypothetical protein [Gammaproteobacteria bacterium]